MNLKTINVFIFLIGCILIYSGYRNVWPHMLVAKSLGREVKPADMWIDPDAAVKGSARWIDPPAGGWTDDGSGGGGGGKAPSFTNLPWNQSGMPYTGGL